VFHTLWCSRRLWWSVYNYRTCCCQFRHSYRAEL
jgi:hypothetical protein